MFGWWNNTLMRFLIWPRYAIQWTCTWARSAQMMSVRAYTRAHPSPSPPQPTWFGCLIIHQLKFTNIAIIILFTVYTSLRKWEAILRKKNPSLDLFLFVLLPGWEVSHNYECMSANLSSSNGKFSSQRAWSVRYFVNQDVYVNIFAAWHLLIPCIIVLLMFSFKTYCLYIPRTDGTYHENPDDLFDKRLFNSGNCFLARK